MGSAVKSSLETSDAPFFLVLFLTSGAVCLTSGFLEVASGTGTAFLTGLAGVDIWGSGFLPAGLTFGFATGLEFLEGAVLAGALLEGAVLAGALLVGALLVGALLVGALLVGALLVGAVLADALDWGTGRDGFFGKDFTGLVGTFFEGAGAGFALVGAFFGAGFFAGALARGLWAALGDTVAFLAGTLLFGFDAETGFFGAGFADFEGRGLPDLRLDFTVGLEGFETFLAALGLAAGRDGLFEEVVFVFNLLSVRLGEKADEHLPHGS